MRSEFTSPSPEELPIPSTPDGAMIGAISIVLTDGTVMTLARHLHHYRVTVVRPGTNQEQAVTETKCIPDIGELASDFLNDLALEPQARATLYTIFTLRSLRYDGPMQRE